MAQRGPAFLDRLKKIKEGREAIEKVVGEGSAPTSYPDQVPPPLDSERGSAKRRNRRRRRTREVKTREPRLLSLLRRGPT